MVNLIYCPENVNLAVSRGDGVIKAGDMAALDEAHSVVRAAEQTSAEITETARAHYQSEKERGYLEGREQADKEAFARLLSEQVYLDRKLLELEADLAVLVKESVRKIISTFDDAALAEATTHSALQRLRRESRVQIFLPPSLIDSFAPIASKLKSQFPEIQSIELIEDAGLAAPDLVVESSTSRIECSLGNKLDALAMVIDEAAAGKKPPADDTRLARETGE
ncbi:hypothetical protein [Roseibium sp.]|uniref:hypothetical protein n=1 Tax=Roseibium sp. TaxID=1936156 RepID=UPI003266EC27